MTASAPSQPLDAARRRPPARLHRFAIISGTGWLLDLCLMASLTAAGVPVFLANCAGAATGVAFVFLVAQRRTFRHDGRWIGGKFAAYALYNAAAIALASLFVAWLARAVALPALEAVPSVAAILDTPARRLTAASVVAKGAVTPLTLYANFLFMGWLLEGRASLR